jgi:hypothetical protein
VRQSQLQICCSVSLETHGADSLTLLCEQPTHVDFHVTTNICTVYLTIYTWYSQQCTLTLFVDFHVTAAIIDDIGIVDLIELDARRAPTAPFLLLDSSGDG